MSGPRPKDIYLTIEQKNHLEDLIRCQTTPKRTYLRAKIILLAAEGCSNAEISRKLDYHRNCIIEWRRRYAQKGFNGLYDLHRSGRPRLLEESVAN